MWCYDRIKREAAGRTPRGTGHCRAHFESLLLVPVALLLIGLLASPAFPSDAKDEKSPLSLFGQRYLKEAELAAEVVVGKVYNLGMGLDVVKVKLGRVIFNRLPPALARRKEQLVLAYRDEFKEGTQLFLILKRFGKGDRLQAIHRLSHLEKHYTDKIELMAAYIAVEQLKDGPAKVKALVSLVLRNLEHKSVWYRRNGLFELKGLVDRKLYAFTRGDVEYLERIVEESKDRSLKEELTALCGEIKTNAVEGPCLLKEEDEMEEEETPSEKELVPEESKQ